MDSSLEKVVGIDPSLVRNTLRGLVNRFKQVYAPCFEKADRIIDFLKDTKAAGHTIKQGSGYDSRYGLTIFQHPTRVAEQYAMLNLAAELIADVADLEAKSQYLKLHGFNLLAHLTKSTDVLSDGKPQKLIPEVLALYSVYQNGGDSTGAERDVLRVMQLRDISYSVYPRFVVALNHQVRPESINQTTCIRKEDIRAIVEAAAAPDLAAAQPPVAKLINLFTAQDDKLFSLIQTADEFVRSELSAGRKLVGHGIAEAIMAYGSNLNNAPIKPEWRAGIKRLLDEQFMRRSIRAPLIDVSRGEKNGYEVAKIDLSKWIRGLKLMNDQRGLDYTCDQILRREDKYLFDALWMLRAMDLKYKEDLKDVLAQVGVQEAFDALLSQSLYHVVEHENKCETGARGRCFLIQLAMVKFLKEHHPSIPAI